MGERHAFRADWLDYNEGIFFVTICVWNKAHIFGKVSDGIMIHNEYGLATVKFLKDIPLHFADTEVHNFVVMPNHVHVLLQLMAKKDCISSENSMNHIDYGRKFGCLKPPRHGEAKEYNHFNSKLAVVIGSFKSAVTRFIRSNQIEPVKSMLTDNKQQLKVWQERFHDHYVANQFAYDNINNYISNNPENWCNDCFYST